MQTPYNLTSKTLLLAPLFIAFIFSASIAAKAQDSTPLQHRGKDGNKTTSADTDTSKYISSRVEVKGEVEIPLVLTLDSLRQMKKDTLINYHLVSQEGAVNEDIRCRGVLLRDILDKAGIKRLNHKDRNFYIVARASDNYKATFSWAELYNNPTGDDTYIIYEMDGKPIKKGEMNLIVTNDIKTGPRHVYWLKSIEVYRVN